MSGIPGSYGLLDVTFGTGVMNMVPFLNLALFTGVCVPVSRGALVTAQIIYIAPLPFVGLFAVVALGYDGLVKVNGMHIL